jgi:hypothetical protein
MPMKKNVKTPAIIPNPSCIVSFQVEG